ncbi:MAG TPA: hypothetical protein VH107_17575, partial [Lacipirellulaceae bacterium]|nr:hypothetical protein [Lacipirellulaceae bacterium]
FRSLGVAAGYYLKYFVLEDETVDEESRRSGLSRQKPKNLKIAQVIDDNTLLIEHGLNQEIDYPAKIEVWRNVDQRLEEINEKLVVYDERRLPALGWEPAPDEAVLTQIMVWLNQWIRQSNIPTGWKRSPLLDTLPADLKSDPAIAPLISAEAMGAKLFKPQDGRTLQESVWLHDISRWAHGDGFDDLSRATALFDWTIRNIQLEPDEKATPHRPWHTLLYGRGSAEQRAWVFAGLCRQQGLNVVVLDFPDDAGSEKSAAEKHASSHAPQHWLVALISKKQLYLFDMRLGLPLPGPQRNGVATLEQIANDDSLLRQLDVEGTPYPLTSELAKQAQAYIVADPFQLTLRAAQLEAGLPGEDHLGLTVNADDVADQLKSVSGIGSVSLWEVPFRTMRDQLSLGRSARHQEALAFEPFALRPALWNARTRHFQGRRKAATTPGGEALDDHQEAVKLYMSKSVRPRETEIAKSPPDKQRVDAEAKLDATYWLGLLSFDDGKYGVAANWFARPELNASLSPWYTGARYNLARSYEAEHKNDDAAQLLKNTPSPQQQGNRIRAEQLTSPTEKTADVPPNN